MPPRRPGKNTKIHPSVFIARNAAVIGDVTIGKSSSVWFSAVLRGDINPVTVGEETNIQDGAVLHVGHGHPCIVGDRVTVGHGAIVHGATVKSDTMIAIGAVVLNGAVIGENCLIGAGAVVTENTVVPPGSLVLGVPGRVIRPVTEDQKADILRAANSYVRLAKARRRKSTRLVSAAKRKS